MTILEPNKSKTRMNVVFVGSIAALIGVALWSIFTYNQTVNLNHDIAVYEKEYKLLLSRNAELKNQLYALTDAKTLRAVASRLGFIPVKNPEYVESSAAALAVSTN